MYKPGKHLSINLVIETKLNLWWDISKALTEILKFLVNVGLLIKFDQDAKEEVEHRDSRTSDKAVHWHLNISLAVSNRSHSQIT